jgi:hypothetical protein
MPPIGSDVITPKRGVAPTAKLANTRTTECRPGDALVGIKEPLQWMHPRNKAQVLTRNEACY